MARTKQNQRPASTVTASTRGGNPPSKVTIGLLTVSALAAIWSVGMLTPAGRVAYVYLFFYAEFYAGVLTLVTLTLTVIGGVLATDRMVLQIPHRVLLQSAHRTTGIMAVSSLVLHIVTQISMGSITAVDAFVPFLASNRAAFIGLGTIASYLLFSAFWVGIVRARFAGRGSPWMWRALHSAAYVSWPVALMHGLNTGRPPATWVTLSYIGSVLLVLIALLVRLSISLNRKKAWTTTGTGSMKPVGKPAPAAQPARTADRPRRRSPREVTVDVIAERAPRRTRSVAASTAVLESRTPPRRRPRRSEEPTELMETRYAAEPMEMRYAPKPPRRPVEREQPAPAARARRSQQRPKGPAEQGYDEDRSRERRPARPTERAYPPESDYPPAEPQYPAQRPRRSEEPEYAEQRLRRSAEREYPEQRPRRPEERDYPAQRPRRSQEREYAEQRSPSRVREEAAEPPPPRRAARDYPPERAGGDDYRDAEAAPRRSTGRDRGRRDTSRRPVDDYQPTESVRRPVDDYLAGAERPTRKGVVDDPVADYLPATAEPSWADTYQRPESGSRWTTEAPSGGRVPADATPANPRLGPQPPRMDPDARSRAFGRHSRDDAYAPSRDDAYTPPRGDAYPPPRSDAYAPSRGDAYAPSRDDAYAAPPRDDIYTPPMAAPVTPASYDEQPDYLPPDDTPTLIDMASRRARRAASESGRAARGSRRRRNADDNSDEAYWRQLRGEAQ